MKQNAFQSVSDQWVRTDPDAAALTLEENAAGDIYPVIYTRRGGVMTETTLPPHPLHDFRTRDNERAVVAALQGILP